VPADALEAAFNAGVEQGINAKATEVRDRQHLIEKKKPSRKRLASLLNSAFITSPSTTSKEQHMTTTQLTPAQHAILAYAINTPAARSTGSPTTSKAARARRCSTACSTAP
jgi:hypothetical protein